MRKILKHIVEIKKIYIYINHKNQITHSEQLKISGALREYRFSTLEKQELSIPICMSPETMAPHLYTS